MINLNYKLSTLALAVAILLVLVACGVSYGAVKKLGPAKKAEAADNKDKPPAEPPKQEDPRKALPTAKVSGKHVVVEMPVEYWKKLNNTNDFISFLDAGFEKEAELMTPKSDVIFFRTDTINSWGLGGGGQVTLAWGAMEDVINQFNGSNTIFGVLHEMGHCFDQPGQQRWYKFPHWLNGETWASIPLTFAFEQLLTTNSNYRIDWNGGRMTGRDFNDLFYLGTADRYLNSTNNWVNIGIDELHSFHLRFIRKYGWDVYKKWYRAAYALEGMGFPPDGGFESPERVVVNCAMLSTFAGENLVPEFQHYRFPVTDDNVRTAAVKFKLNKVYAAVEQQFAREVADGAITLDPLSLRIATTNLANGNVRVTIRSVKLNGSAVRYSVDGKDPSSSSPLYTMPLTVGRKLVLKAALFGLVNSKPSAADKVKKKSGKAGGGELKKFQALVRCEETITPSASEGAAR